MANNRKLSQFANTVGYDDGSVGIGTDKPLDPPHASNTKVLSVGIVTANYLYGDGSNLTGISGGGGINTDAQNNHYGIDQNGQSFDGTNATDNTLFGHQAGYNITTADKNVVIGSLAGDALTTGSENVAVGYNAGSGETTQNGDTAVGAHALSSNTGQYNVGLGYRAGTSVGSGGDFEICIGYWAGAYMSGDNNISMGNFSMGGRTTTGQQNIAIGQLAGYDLGGGEKNVMVGTNAGYGVIGGDYNTFIGERAGYHFDNNASSNIAIGRRAGYNLDGNNNTIIGSMEYTGITTMNGVIAIGAGTTERLRVDSNGKIGIGTNTPARLLHLHESNSNEALICFTTPTTGATASDGFRVGMNGSEEAIVWNNESGIIKFGTANTERFRIDADGYRSFSTQPYALLRKDGTSQSITADAFAQYDETVTSEGGMTVSTNKDRITVPKTGKYAVFGSVAGSNTTVSVGDGWRCEIWLNGSVYSNIYTYPINSTGASTGEEYNLQSHLILPASANDYFEIRVASIGSARANVRYGYFCVYYLG